MKDLQAVEGGSSRCRTAIIIPEYDYGTLWRARHAVSGCWRDDTTVYCSRRTEA